MARKEATGNSEDVELTKFIGTINHKIRIQMLILLYENVEMSYSELRALLGINEGLFNFHLRKMRDFLKTTSSGTYILSKQGATAYRTIKEIKETFPSQRSLDTQPTMPKPSASMSIISRRVLAFFIDGIILFLSTGLFLDSTVSQVVSDITALRPPDLSRLDLTFDTFVGYSHVFLMAFILFTLLEAYKGQTLGKYIVRIRVIKVGGGKITLLDSAIRNLGKVLLLPLDLAIGVIWYLRKGYVRFFDYYTGTTVERCERFPLGEVLNLPEMAQRSLGGVSLLT